MKFLFYSIDVIFIISVDSNEKIKLKLWIFYVQQFLILQRLLWERSSIMPINIFFLFTIPYCGISLSLGLHISWIFLITVVIFNLLKWSFLCYILNFCCTQKSIVKFISLTSQSYALIDSIIFLPRTCFTIAFSFKSCYIDFNFIIAFIYFVSKEDIQINEVIILV